LLHFVRAKARTYHPNELFPQLVKPGLSRQLFAGAEAPSFLKMSFYAGS
jgi:hypothetical protein